MTRQRYSTRRHIDPGSKETKNGVLRTRKDTQRYKRKATNGTGSQSETTPVTSSSKVITPPKPIGGAYRCKICGTYFDRSSQLKSHLLEHGTDRPFPCFTCNIRFTTKWNLMKHQNCRSHRVVLAKIMNSEENDQRPSKIVPIKKRRIDWSSDQQSDQNSSPVEKMEIREHISAGLHSIRFSILPSTSRIAAQLKPSHDQLLPLESYFNPTQTIAGKLNIPLLGDERSLELSIEMAFDEVKKCLNARDLIVSPNSEMQESAGTRIEADEDDVDQKIVQANEDSLSSSASSNMEVESAARTTVNASSGNSKRMKSCTHEEIQAAQTILSFANPPKLHSDRPTSPMFTSWEDPNPKQSTSPSVGQHKVSTNIPTAFRSLDDSMPTNPASLQAPLLIPITSAPCTECAMRNPNSPSPPILVEQPTIYDGFPFEIRSEIDNGPIKPRPTIRAPPKKRHSIQYECLPEPVPMSKQHRSTEHLQSIPLSSITPISHHTTGSGTEFSTDCTNSTVSIISSQRCAVSTVISASNSESAAITGTNTVNVVPYNPPTIPSPPNFVILPQFMVVPRVINPYLPVVTSQPFVNTCLLFPTSCGNMRTTTICSNVTNSLVTPIPTPIRTLTPPISSNHPTNNLYPLTNIAHIPHNHALNMAQTIPHTPIVSLNAAAHGMVSQPVIIAPSNGEFRTQKSGLLIPPSSGHVQPVILPPIAPNTINPRATIFTKPTSITTEGLRTSTPTRSEPFRLVTLLPATKESFSPLRPIQPIQLHPDQSVTLNQSLPSQPAQVSTASSDRSYHRPLHPKLTPATTRLLVNRNKYRCFECGLVCYKPCLLRKHYRTHSNVRPYLCQHCDISFKTRGNLSKHMKSRGHYDRCVRELGLVQAPLVVDDTTQVDRQALEKQRQLVVKRDPVKRELWRSHMRSIKANGSVDSRQTTPIILNSKYIPKLVSKPSLSSRRIWPRRRRLSNRIERRRIKTVLTSNTTKNPATSFADIKPRPSNNTTPVIAASTDINNRQPAPNVNVVNIPQDLPLNLSVHPRQPTTTLIAQQPDITNQSSGAMSMTNSNATVSSRSDIEDTEKMVQTAVEAARTLNHGLTSDCVPMNRSSQDQPIVSVVTLPSTTPTIHSQSTTLDSSNSSIEVPPDSISIDVERSKRTPVNVIVNSGQSNTIMPDQPTINTLTTVSRNRASKTNDASRDPRPYKCNECRIGFRVTGHLYKHYRSKSHLITILQLHQVPTETLEAVRQSRVTSSQIVNPDTGQLRAKGLERLLVIKSGSSRKG